MDISVILDIALHLDTYLFTLIESYGIIIYGILFLVILCETGLVVTPFLPGDSLLFAAGTLAAMGMLNIFWVMGIIVVAAILGDALNYAIGSRCGYYLIRYPRLLNPKYMARTRAFYHKHGGKTIVLARFMPIIRTLAPFVAGIGRMPYTQFFKYNITGAILWTGLLSIGGYLFGKIPIVRDNFSLVVITIIIISMIPLLNELRSTYT